MDTGTDMDGTADFTATGSRIVVTGASSGIGAALAVEFARRHRGARLLLLGRDEARLSMVAADVQRLGATARTAAPDVTDRAALQAAADAFVDAVHGVDLVVANAGIGRATVLAPDVNLRPGDGSAYRDDAAVHRDDRAAGQYNGATHANDGATGQDDGAAHRDDGAAARAARALDDRIMATNWRGMLDTFDAFLPSMRAARRGVLVGTASLAALRGVPGRSAYCASKAAALRSLEALRGELRPDGIDVLALVPGFVRTPLTAGNRFPMPFLMQPDDFARRAVCAIDARRPTACIPWQMGVLARLGAGIPASWSDAWLARRSPH